MKRISTFSERLWEGLTEAKMRPSDLSQLTGISRSSISHYLKGDWEGKQDAVLFISKALNVSEAWLMGYDVPKERTSSGLKEQKPTPEGEPQKDVIVLHRNGERIEYHLTEEQLQVVKPLLDQLNSKNDPDF